MCHISVTWTQMVISHSTSCPGDVGRSSPGHIHCLSLVIFLKNILIFSYRGWDLWPLLPTIFASINSELYSRRAPREEQLPTIISKYRDVFEPLLGQHRKECFILFPDSNPQEFKHEYRAPYPILLLHLLFKSSKIKCKFKLFKIMTFNLVKWD